MPPMVMMIVVFLLIIGVAGLALFLFRDSGGGGKTSTRLDIMVGKKKADSGTEMLLRQSASELDKAALLSILTSRIPNMDKLFEQADCHIKPSTLMGIGAVLAAVFMTLTWIRGLMPVYVLPLVGLVGFAIPFLWLWNKRRGRLKMFANQLPDAMELVARALRAGHALGAGMHVVAEEMPSPISDEFGRVYEEQNLGIALEDAMRGMCDRVPNLDLRFFVTSVAIQRQTGGDLAEILDKIGYVIRERYKILGQVKALTAEGRLSGVVLIGLPFVLFLVMYFLRPEYVAMLWQKPLGIRMLWYAIASQIFGAIVIKKIIDIKV